MGEILHNVKSIHFLGRRTPIVLHREDAPCPLLAICNVLLLRNQLSLRSNTFEVSQAKLVHLVGDRIRDCNSKLDGKDALYDEYLRQKTSDAIDLLPCLTTGVDVNVKFCRIGDFEYTRECAIFDLLDIPLYHGWLVDPQDHDTAKAIGSKSYNTITRELVMLEETNRKGKEVSVGSDCASSERTMIRKGDAEEEADLLRILELSKMESREEDLTANSADIPQKNHPLEEVEGERSTSGASADLVLGLEVDVSKFESCPTEELVRKTQHPDSTQLESDLQVESTPKTSLNEERYKECTIENLTLMSPNCDSSTSTGSSTSTLGSSEWMFDSPTAHREDREPVYEGMTQKEGELVKNFLLSNASQLTYHGLFSLYKELKEGLLCVFFRNDHFSTAIKFEGGLYLLATDHGYLNAPRIVWEKLNDISGASVYCDSDFKEFMPEGQANGAWVENTLTTASDYLPSTRNFTKDFSGYEFLQEQEKEQLHQTTSSNNNKNDYSDMQHHSCKAMADQD